MKKWLRYESLIDKADWHIHTNYTDGQNTIDEYCRKAVDNGLKCLAFTEHVRREMSYDFEHFIKSIEEARKYYPLKILVGCEAKVIDINGTLDASEKLLRQCDVVTGVFHSFPWTDKQRYLISLKAMLENPHVDIWGHPFLFAKNNEIFLQEYEKESIINLCVKNQVLIERNLKYCLPDASFITMALSKEASLVIGSDSHCADDLPTLSELNLEWQSIISC